jgi:putative endonuclease
LDKMNKLTNRSSIHFRQQLGSWGEKIAADYMQKQGYQIVERNYRTVYGEIDLVAHCDPADPNGQKDKMIGGPITVFVEVKTRRSLKYGYPEQAVNAQKRAHLISAAQEYIQQHPEIRGDWRVDVISIIKPKDGSPPQVLVFENAVSGE